MPKRPSSFPRCTLALSLATLALPAIAAPTVYEMRLSTLGGIGAGGFGSILSLFGAGSNLKHSMDLRLTSPSELPNGYQATHTVPDALRIGPQLPLQGETRTVGGKTTSEETTKESEPDGRLLIYWGCSATVPKGQPEIISFRSMYNKLSPEIQAMIRQGRNQGKAVQREVVLNPRTLNWPAGDRDFRGIPDNGSVVGDHVVKANFMNDDIRFTLTPALDFLEPMNLKAQSSDLKTAIPLVWDALTRVRGYDMQAVSTNGDKDVILWLAARNKSPMLPGTQHDCTIPEGIFAKSEMAMLSAIAHGPTQGFSYPPQKPGEKKPLIWTANVQVNGYDSALLGMEKAAAGAAGNAAQEAVLPGVGNLLKGLFGR